MIFADVFQFEQCSCIILITVCLIKNYNMNCFFVVITVIYNCEIHFKYYPLESR